MKLSRIGIFAATIVACAFSASAQLVWKVTGNGIEKPSYLFGTCHVVSAKMTDSIPGFDEAINNCDVVYGEIEKTDIAAAQTSMMGMLAAPADSTLSKVLDVQTLAKIDSLLKASTGGMVGASQLEMLKPAVVSTQLAFILMMQEFPDFNPAEQIDLAVQDIANQKGKALRGFETSEFQINLMYGDPISEQAEDLTKIMADLDKNKKLSRALAKAYKTQDMDAIYKVVMDDYNESYQSQEEKERDINKMFYDRNSNWAKTLCEVMPQKSVLVVVGAGHLPGDKGLIDLLTKQGFTVEPMK